MSSKTVKRHPYVQRQRPRDGGSYKRERDGSLTRIPDPVEVPEKGAAAAALPSPAGGSPKAADTPAPAPSRIAAD